MHIQVSPGPFVWLAEVTLNLAQVIFNPAMQTVDDMVMALETIQGGFLIKEQLLGKVYQVSVVLLVFVVIVVWSWDL